MNAPFERLFLVCTAGKTCPGQGGEAVHAALKDGVFAAGLGDRVRVNKGGCLSQCGHGPMIAVFPENRWYAGVRPEDVPEILATDVLGGRPLERLLFRPARPGKNVRVPDAKP
ncbi:MAG: (2Fe-2S) ferredoxin domain-containing protein [Planctomycetaceae bacterium]|nr:(2Fe-2S) ferredoxin domain-containing protein [Planctomycetota bacterium]NUN53923.1 (2Fe-2S) ferredoxin domain-containing protein [Planctomycetaceae bacterium]